MFHDNDDRLSNDLFSGLVQDVQIKVCAILNDTTGTLMSCAWKNHNCKIGLIVGRSYTVLASALYHFKSYYNKLSLY